MRCQEKTTPRLKPFHALGVICLLEPLGLQLIGSGIPGASWFVHRDLDLVLLNAVYLWLPYGVALIVGFSWRRARRQFVVPARESSLVWIFYLPLSMLVLVGGFQAARSRNPSVRPDH